MATYRVTVEARLSYAVIQETYEVEAANVDDAEAMVLEGEGDLIFEEVTDGETIEEYVTQVCTMDKGVWKCS